MTYGFAGSTLVDELNRLANGGASILVVMFIKTLKVLLTNGLVQPVSALMVHLTKKPQQVAVPLTIKV
jgi:hypothetical protein